jgi:RNA recognition motif-containing protein
LVFIRNWPSSCDEDKLKGIFEKFGQITGVKIERDTAEVYFTSSFSATKASESANGSVIGGKCIKVTYYAQSEPK